MFTVSRFWRQESELRVLSGLVSGEVLLPGGHVSLPTVLGWDREGNLLLCLFFNVLKLFFFNFLTTPCSMWDLGSLTKDQTHTLLHHRLES